MFKDIPVSDLAAWCRACHHGLQAGLSPVKLLRMQGKSGPRSLREMSQRVADRLAQGKTWGEALSADPQHLPPVMLEIIQVGDEAGRLDDVFGELASYFEASRAVRQEFLRIMTPPAMQLAAAVIIVAVTLVVLGEVAAMTGREAVDILGLGLTGFPGAAVIIVGFIGLAALLYLAYRFLAKHNAYRPRIEQALLRLPLWGPAFLHIALARFSLALRVTHEAGLRADEAVSSALRATANAAFADQQAPVATRLRRGQGITSTLAQSGAPFPEEYLAAFAMAEESGQLSEVLQRLVAQHQEEALRKLKSAAQITAYIFWVAVALFLIVLIFLFASIYFNQLAG